MTTTAQRQHRRRVTHLLPVLTWMRAYDRRWLLPDVLAGVAVWAIVVPEGAAYAQLAGLPPQAALAAAPIGLLAYALLGTSRGVVVGATTASAVVVGSTIGPLAAGGTERYASLAAALTLLVGAAFLILGVANLGWISQFLSRPVTTGFVFGLGLVVAVGQVPKLTGVHGAGGNFFQRAWDVGRHVDGVNGPTLAVGAAALAILFALDRYARHVPGALVVVALGIAVTALLGLDANGVAIVGSIPAGLPAPALPSGITAGDLGALAPGALAVCLIAYSEHMASVRQLAGEQSGPRGEDIEIDPNQELLALGVANVGAALVRGFALGGSLSKSEVNARAGARSQVSSLSAAALALVTVVALTGVFHDLPQAVLGAVVIHAVSGLMRVDVMRRFWRIRRADFVLAATALAGELLLDVLPGLLLAVGLSLAHLIYRASRPHVAVLGRLPGTTTYADVQRHPESERFPGIVILRPEAELFFANATVLRFELVDAVRHGGSPPPRGLLLALPVRALVCDIEATSDLDVDGALMLEEVAVRLGGMGCTLHLARVRDPVQDVLRRAGSSVFAAGRCHRTVDSAVAAAREELGEPPPPGAPSSAATSSDQ